MTRKSHCIIDWKRTLRCKEDVYVEEHVTGGKRGMRPLNTENGRMRLHHSYRDDLSLNKDVVYKRWKND